VPPGSPGKSNPNLVKIFDSFATGRIAVKDPQVSGLTHPSTYLNQLWTEAGVPNTNRGTLHRHGELVQRRRKDRLRSMSWGDAGTGHTDIYHANFGLRVVRTDLGNRQRAIGAISDVCRTARGTG